MPLPSAAAAQACPKCGNPPPKKARQKRLRAVPDDELPLLRLMVRRPTRRGECEVGPRPCPFVSCRHHLALNVTKEGRMRFPHGSEPEDLSKMKQTCALDAADDGGMSVADVAELMGISRQRTAQLEAEAMPRLQEAIRASADRGLLADLPILRRKFAEMDRSS